MKTLKFTKMHGLGNDFMVVNGIGQDFDPLTAPLAEWSDRFRGVGFDQLLRVEKPSSDAVDFRYRIFNADGSEVEQCGNGARCFARFVADKGLTDKKEILVETAKGVIIPKLLDNGLVTVNMGKPRFTSSEIPFVPVPDEADDALTHMVMVGLETVQVSCVNMGNPHAVIVVEDVQTAPVDHWGEAIESTNSFRNVSTSALCRLSIGNLSACAYLNAVWVKLRLAVRGLVRPWWRASVWGCWRKVCL